MTTDMLAAKICKVNYDLPSINLLNFKDNLKIPTIALTSKNIIRPYEEIEKEVILKTIEYCNGNRTYAAKSLKIGKTTLFNKVKQYNKSSDR